MKKIEYRYYDISTEGGTQEDLNALGQEGWQICAVTKTGWFVLSRELEQKQQQ